MNDDYKFYNVGRGKHRSEQDFFTYGFIGAGQVKVSDSREHYFSKELRRLHPGDKFFAYKRKIGYIAFGEVLAEAVPIDEFMITENKGKKLYELPNLASPNLKENHDNKKCEWCAKVKWIKILPERDAVKFPDMFVSRNVVCNIYGDKHPETLAALKKAFGIEG